MKLSKKQWSQVGVWGIGAAMYIGIFAAFILMLSITNEPLLRLSRTAAITMSTSALLLGLFSHIYGGLRVGEMRPRGNVYSLTIAAVLTDIISYFQLQVMNVNEYNNERLMLFGPDLALLVGAMVAQVAIISLAVYIGNKLYFRYNPPTKCIIIAGTEEDGALMRRKLEQFKAKYSVEKCLCPGDEGVRAGIKESETVFLFHLPADKHRELIEYCYKHGRTLYFDSNIEDILARNCDTFLVDDIQMTVHSRSGLTIPQRFAKRTVDIIASLLGLIIASPIMLACAIAIHQCDGGPVFFRQKRMSRNGHVFDIIKFRTMKEHADDIPQHSAEADDPRVTKVGKVLRRTRLDELPQLINILKGEMSVVGPRPEMLENIANYTRQMPEFAYRNRVKAGLTGMAQINGKYNTPPREKLMMDISYIENYSLWLDIKLILKTVLVFFRDDATEPFEKGEEHAE